jgi:hypothetical protein
MKQVGKGRNLIADRLHYRRCRVAHRRDCDAGTEVNQLVSVDVDQDATACPLDEDAERSADARGNGRFLRANSSFERGPGSSVTRRRACTIHRSRGLWSTWT